MKLALLVTLIASINLSSTAATITEGSTTTHRSNVDGDSGEIYVYIGGSFPAGTAPNTFTFLWDFVGRGNNSTGYITPLLLERAPGPFYTTYVIRAIGQGFSVAIGTSPQTIPFNIVEGVTITPNADYTFGYVNALVNSSGVETSISAGTVDMDYPADSGAGVGPHSVNQWAATGSTTVTVALGTSIGATPGTDFPWVDYIPIRTYSAQAVGTLGAQ